MTIGSTNINIWQRVDITLRDRYSTATTVIRTINREQPTDVDSFLFPSFLFPILLNITAVGAGINGAIVIPDGGTIDLIDDPGSFSNERKFSDLLQNYSISDQDIEIFLSTNTLGDGKAGSWTSIAKVKGKQWRSAKRTNGHIVTIEFQSNYFRRRKVGMTVARNNVFQNLPIESVGARLPVCIGTAVEASPVLISELGSTTALFAYAADLYTDFTHAGPSGILARKPSGEYVDVTSAPSGSNFLVFQSYAGTGTTTDAARILDAEYARQIDAAYGYVLTGGRILCNGSRGVASGASILTISIYGSNNTGASAAPQFLLGTANVDKSGYSAQWTGGANFYINFSFNTPIVAAYPKLFISFKEGCDVNTDWTPYRYNNATTEPIFQRDNTVAGNNNWKYTASFVLHQQIFELFGVAFDDDAVTAADDTDSEGYIHRRLRVQQQSAGTGQTVPDLSTLPFLVQVDGITDNAAGDITGTPNDPITLTQHVCHLLDFEWDPSGLQWADSATWDFTSFATSHALASNPADVYFRQCQGRLNTGQSVETIIADLARNLGFYVGLNNSGKFILWCWGDSRIGSEVANYTQENSRIVSCRELDYSFVINHPRVRYAPVLRALQSDNRYYFENIRPYSESTEMYSGQNPLADNLIGFSSDIYGERFLDNDRFDYIGDSASAEFLCRFLTASFGRPPVIVELEIPFLGNQTIKQLDVVTVRQPELMAYYGASPSALSPQYGGSQIDVSGGFTYSRSEFFRAIVMGRRVSLSRGDGPIITLTLRLLLNHGNDPT